MSEKLKPCPFCGCEAEVRSNAAKGMAWVECSRCFGQSGGYEDGERAMHNLRDTAAREWNCRKPHDEIEHDAAFLLDKLESFERDLLDDEVGSEFAGHVSPAIARLRASLAKASLPTTTGKEAIA